MIPALYKRHLVKHLVSLLLLQLGFGGCFVVQDHVAATFGAGLAAACVVDCGDQKTSISCVEDGVSQPHTRIHLGYGGSDVTVALEGGGGVGGGGLAAHGRKEGGACSLEPGGPGRTAALGLFQPELLLATGGKVCGVQYRDPGDPEDPHDHLYLRETSRKYNKTGELPGGEEEGGQFEDGGAVGEADQATPDLGAATPGIHTAVLRR